MGPEEDSRMTRECKILFVHPDTDNYLISGTIHVRTGNSAIKDREFERSSKKKAEIVWEQICKKKGYLYVYGIKGSNILTLKSPDELEPQTS